MMPLHCYFDIEVRPGAGLDVSLPDIHAMVLRFLHRSGHRFVVAFPQMNGNYFGPVFRVFGSSESDLVKLHDYLNGKPVLEDYCVVGSVSNVPMSKVSGYDIFRQINVKSVQSRERRRLRRGGEAYAQRAQELIRQKNRELDFTGFLKIQSLSTGQSFKLFLRREPTPETAQGFPTSYGFSRGGSVIPVPKF